MASTSTTPSANDPTAALVGKTWELSLYELHRTRQNLITDETPIAVSPQSLNSELMCPICLEMLTNTMTTMECLHRFCADCIITALRSGNKECPTCRKKLASKRSLRPDPNYDRLIAAIYPNREEYEAEQAAAIAEINQRTVSANLEAALRRQTLLRTRGGGQGTAKQPKQTHNLNDDDNQDGQTCNQTGFPGGSSSAATAVDDSNDATEHFNNVNQSEVQVELIIKPLQMVDLMNNSLNATRYVKMSISATIEHIAKYLKMRQNLELSAKETETVNGETTGTEKKAQQGHPSQHPFAIYLSNGPGQYKPLAGSVTLNYILETYWKASKPLELFYAVKVSQEDDHNGTQ